MTALVFRGVMGDGSYGVVHHLYDPSTKLSVARKYFFDPKKCEIECANSKEVKCTHIVPFLASGTELPLHPIRCRGKKVNGPLSYLEMPLMHCGSLFDIGFIPLKQSLQTLQCDLTADLVYSWGICVLHGLNYLHKRLFKIHGDIKPANILIDQCGSAMIGDLGAMQAIPLAGQKMHPEGTDYYMPPEVHSNGRLTFQIDIWSLGITLYEVCDGRRPWSRIKYCATPRDAIELIKIGYVPFDIFQKITMNDKLLSLLQLCLIKDCDSRPTAAQILDFPTQRNWRAPKNWAKRDWSFTTPAQVLFDDMEKIKKERDEAAKAAESNIAELRRQHDKTRDTALADSQKERALLQNQLQRKHDEQLKTVNHNSDAARKVLESKLAELAEGKKAVELGMFGLSKEIDVLNGKVQEFETKAVTMEVHYESKLSLQISETNKAKRSKRKWKCRFNELKSDLGPILHKYAAHDPSGEDEIEEMEAEDEDGEHASGVFSPSNMAPFRGNHVRNAKAVGVREASSVEVIEIPSPPDLTEPPSSNEQLATSASQKRKPIQAPNLNWEEGEEERLGADLKDLVDEVFDQNQLKTITLACTEFSVRKEVIHAFLEVVAKNFKEVAAGAEVELELSAAAGKLVNYFAILHSERWHRYEKFFAFVGFVKCTDPRTKQTTAYFGSVVQNVFQKRPAKESYEYRLKECLKTFEKYSAANN